MLYGFLVPRDLKMLEQKLVNSTLGIIKKLKRVLQITTENHQFFKITCVRTRMLNVDTLSIVSSAIKFKESLDIFEEPMPWKNASMLCESLRFYP